jgi:CHAT domain-containing protein
LPPPGTWHCVFDFGPDTILRWTATHHGVSCDTLETSPAECRRRVERVLELMTVRGANRSPADPSAHELLETLAGLARALLPPEVLEQGTASVAPTTLYVTPDGPLALLPFEALSLTGDRYRPLVLRHDVAYVRGMSGPPAPRATGPAIILADPEMPPELSRRFAVSVGLEEARREARWVHRAWSGSRIVGGAEATKRRVLDFWRRAPRVYLAAHLVRNPEIPFLAFFPMAGPAGPGPSGEAYLELTDIRGLDLEGCELVILSTCAGGQAYLTLGDRVAPSMSDGFLDAGARAVVKSCQPVGDEEAGRFMRLFLGDLDHARGDPVRAISATRRRLADDQWGERGRGLAGAGGWDWALWSVSLRGVPVAASRPVALRGSPTVN